MHYTVQSDVRSLSDLESLTARVKAAFGGLDILFANAGIGLFAPLHAIDEAFYDDQFDINVKGVFFTVQKLAELLNQGASVILNASAVHEKGAAMEMCTLPQKRRCDRWRDRWRDRWLPNEPPAKSESMQSVPAASASFSGSMQTLLSFNRAGGYSG